MQHFFHSATDKRCTEIQPSPSEAASLFGVMSTTPIAPSQRRSRLLSSGPSSVGGAELDAGQKFWWMDWNRMIRDAITAMRTAEPVLYDGE